MTVFRDPVRIRQAPGISSLYAIGITLSLEINSSRVFSDNFAVPRDTETNTLTCYVQEDIF